MDTLKDHAWYLTNAFAEPEFLIERARTTLEGVEYDTMIGTGLSGALVVPLLARAFGKSWAIVRKGVDNSHSGRDIEGVIGRRWLFVDDLIDYGGTLRRVMDKVHEEMDLPPRHETHFVGAHLYGTTPEAPARFRGPEYLSERYGARWVLDDCECAACRFCEHALGNTAWSE